MALFGFYYLCTILIKYYDNEKIALFAFATFRIVLSDGLQKPRGFFYAMMGMSYICGDCSQFSNFVMCNSVEKRTFTCH